MVYEHIFVCFHPMEVHFMGNLIPLFLGENMHMLIQKILKPPQIYNNINSMHTYKDPDNNM